MNTDITSEDVIPVLNQQARISPMRRRVALALSLSILMGIGILAAVMVITQNASAQSAPKGQGTGTPPVSGRNNSPDCGPNWAQVASPNHGTNNNYLYGVAAESSDDVWAVGIYYNSNNVHRTLIEHWNGVAWSVASSPNVGTNYNELYGVTAISANDVWAVGYYVNGTAGDTLTEHWDGTAWTVVSSPNPGTNDSEFYGVTAISASNVWAVGYYYNGTRDKTLVEHWNGATWSAVTSPNVGTNINYLLGVTAVSSNDIWAVGWYANSNNNFHRTLIEHWDGTAWNVVSSPNPNTSGNVLVAVAAVASNDVWAVGAGGTGSPVVDQTLIEHWNGSNWSVVSSPSPGTGNSYLNGVSAVASNDVWAVGYYRDSSTDYTIMEHWNGTQWSTVAGPNPGTGNVLAAVAAVSSSDVWAVGVTVSGSSLTTQTLVERYNPCPPPPPCGPNWVTIYSPNFGTSTNYLYGVSALSSNDVWAVGTYADTSMSHTLIEHWNGTAWSRVPSPNPGTTGNGLTGVKAIAADNVWAVGAYSNTPGGPGGAVTLVLHWNGSVWNVVSSPNPGTALDSLTGISAVSANDIWAVGYYESVGTLRLPYRTLVLHWDGSAWNVVPSPSVGISDNYLTGVAAVSANDVWAVGYYTDSSTSHTLIEHWDGTQWSIVAGPNPGTSHNYLAGVTAISTNDVWAVGYYVGTSSSQTLALHWNGSAWSQVPSPSPGTAFSLLNGVAAVSADDVWAVGNYSTSSSAGLTLIEQWNGSAWSVVPSPNPDTYDNGLYAVAALSANDVWAVGTYRTSSSNPYLTLVEHYNPCTATPTPGGPTLTPTSTATAIPTQCTVQFEDVPNPSTFYQYVQCLACKGFIGGYACGGQGEPCDPNHDPYFRPNNDVTRGQIAKIVALSAGINTPVSGQTFEDVAPGSTFYTYVEQLHALGVMNGYACGGSGEPCIPPTNRPYFRPNANATRGQLAKIDSLTAGYSDPPSGQQFQDVAAGSTYYPYAYRLAIRSIMGGYACGGSGEPCVPPANLPYFRPNADVTRGQTAKIVANTFFPNCQAP